MSDQSRMVALSDLQLTQVDQFQRDKALASREAAVALLLDVAFEAVTGNGRRFWDKPVIDRDAAPPTSAPPLD